MKQPEKVGAMAVESSARQTVDAPAIEARSNTAESGVIEPPAPPSEEASALPDMDTLEATAAASEPSFAASGSRVSELLTRWSSGDKEAFDELAPAVFDHLHLMAKRRLRKENKGHTLQTTALVNEVFLKLLGKRTVAFDSHRKFFGFVAEEMRRILVDHARKRNTQSRGSGKRPSSLEKALNRAEEIDLDLAELNEALEDLKKLDPDASRVVDLRFFVGLTHRETADAMDVSVAKARRLWAVALVWLKRHLTKKGASGLDASQ
ncbi:MAG: sigma-70 family RNA polymerase sigma factor [bacterium]|nr:sigma-70 family RNA polymerase sigma factor [bacterium]